MFLNPANIMIVGGNDPDFVELEKLSKILLVTHLIPAEQALNNLAHGLEVHVAREGEVLFGRCSKPDVHGSFQFSSAARSRIPWF